MRWAKQWETRPVASSLRWISRLLAVLALAMIGAFMFGTGGIHLFQFNQQELALMAPFWLAALGLIVGLRKEVLGGIITVVAIFCFYWLHHYISGSFPRGWAFAFIALPGVCFITTSYIGAWELRRCQARRHLPL